MKQSNCLHILYMLRKILFTLCGVLLSTSAKSQIMFDGNSRTIVEAEVENRPVIDDDDPTVGKTHGHAYLSHYFVFDKTQRLGIDGRYEANDGNNNYYRYSVKGMKTFLLSNHKPLIINASVYGEASDYGQEHIDGHLVGFYMYSMTQKKQAGVGLVVLLNNPSGIPCIPMFVMRKSLSATTSFNFATYLASITHTINDNLSLSAGYTMSSQRFWMKQEGVKYMDNKSIFSPLVVLQWQAHKGVYLGAYAGYRVQMTHKLYTADGKHKVAELGKKHTPFVSLRATVKC